MDRSNEPPDKTVNLLKKINDSQLSLFTENFSLTNEPAQNTPSLNMPAHHYVPMSAQLKRALETAYDRQPESFETLVALPGVGAGSLKALALVAEIIHGVKPSYRDPVRYSFAHGGKDGHPFPVDRTAYRNSIESLEKALSKAKLGDPTKIKAFKKLSFLQRSI